jgi:hypothetical protein
MTSHRATLAATRRNSTTSGRLTDWSAVYRQDAPRGAIHVGIAGSNAAFASKGFAFLATRKTPN